MEKIGIIDLGSNSARLVIVNLFQDGYFMVVDELKESVRLGQDMERDGFLKPQRVAETIKTLKMFRKLCDASGVSRIITVATEAVRKAKNQRSFLEEIQANCGIKIKVLTAVEEATSARFFFSKKFFANPSLTSSTSPFLPVPFTSCFKMTFMPCSSLGFCF